ncbi:MAG: glycosyltransferase [Gemmatimonadota bacterium]
MSTTRRTAPLRVLHVDSGQEWQSVRDQVRLLVDGLAVEPRVEQAVATLTASRLEAECEELGVPVIPLPLTAGGDPRALQVLARYARSAWDVYHAHDGTALEMLLYIQALDGSNTPLVATRRFGVGPSVPRRWRRASVVLATSRSARDGLVRAGVEPNRIAVVPHGIDAEAPVAEEPGTLRTAIGASPTHRLVASFTALSRHRDHTTLLRAARRLVDRHDEARFAVLGRGPERPKIEDLVERYGLEGRVCLPGYLPDARRYMCDLDVFVMPAFHEELTSACLEAMVAGVPVVMPSAAASKGTDGAPGPVRVPPGDAEAMADAIEELLRDEHRHREAARRGRAFARRHGAASLVARTLRAYRRVVEPRRARRPVPRA